MTEERNERPLKILEIGGNILFKFAVPDQVDLFWCGLKPYGYGRGKKALGPFALLRCLIRIFRGYYDLVVIHPNLYPVRHPRAFLTIIRSWPLSFPRRLFAAWALWLFRFMKGFPIAAVDLADSFGIQRHNFFLFSCARYVFKRELPADNWQVFYRTGHRRLPTASFRRKRRYQKYLRKVRPLGIGFFRPVEKYFEFRSDKKTVDIFFAGQGENTSTIRSKGLKELAALREEGLRVDIAESKIEHDEYLKRCAAAWLVWSPSGFGWECFRHYETPLTGAVPVMNYPTIDRYMPFDDGVHCFFYPAEPGGLSRTIRSALSDKERLERMAKAASDHVCRYHTFYALSDYVASATIGRYLDGRQIEGSTA